MNETMSEVKISYKKNQSITKEEACLRIIEGSPRNQYLFLPEGEIIVGRKDSNYIVIKDQRIDEVHAKIKNNKGKVDIVGIGLKSRIFINGKQLKFRTSHTLQKNDRIEIGRSTFQYLPAGEFKNFIDPLLQIYNIDYLLKSSETGFRNGQNMSLLLLICDSDYFGKINKNHGHEARDYTLIELSKLIQNECGDKNVFARYEGEKFAILLINTNLKLVYGAAEKIRSSIETYQFIVNDETLPSITFSIGISEVNSSVKKSKDLLNHAEEACRKAKEYGRNRIVMWENEQISTQNDPLKYLKYSLYSKFAEIGKHWDQNNLGICYKDGLGTKADERKAFEWFKKSAEGGNHLGQCNLGHCYRNGIGTQKSELESLKWYMKSAEDGNFLAQATLADWVRNGVCDINEDMFNFFHESANNGSHLGQGLIALCFLFGIRADKDDAKAFQWARKSTLGGNSLGQNNLGLCYQNGIGVKKDDAKAFLWYKKSAQGGDTNGQCNLGFCYKNGIGVEKDDAKAFLWYEKSAQGGDINGQCGLGACYQKGIGVEKDETIAFQWYEKSAQGGNIKGQRKLGFCYKNGIGVKKDEQKALHWYEKSTQDIDINRQYYLGVCYQSGIFVKKDYAKAFQWYKKSARGGNINGQCQLGICYLDGIGVKKNSKKALRWLQLSANCGNHQAYKKLQSPIPSQIPPYPSFSPKENEILKIDKKWYSILSEELPLIEPQQYFILNKIIPQPKLSYCEIYGNVAAILPYILQKVKMWGVNILKAENFVNLVNDEDEASFIDVESSDDEESSDNESKLENQKLIKNNRLSRFDCIAALFASTETTVVQDIFRIISQFPIALPLLMPNLNKAEKFKVMFPSYTGTAIKWYTSNGSIIENRIFEDSFKMIVAVRIGMNPQGKSTILNQLMVSKYMFTSHSEPRADYGIPLMINGSVEFVWLTEETCGVDLWNSVFKSYYKEEGRNEIALLANLHGDALDYPDQIEFLKQLPSCFLVFLMPGHDENQIVEFRNLIGSKKVIYIYVNPENSVEGKDNYTIDTKSLMDYKTIKVACKMFKDVLDHNPADSGGFSINTLKIGKTLQFAENLECVESQKIIDFIKEKTCRYIRLKIMQLQTKQSGSDCLQFWECTPELQELMRSFSSIIVLPIRVRRKALAHLEKEISRLFTVESSKPWNDAISKRKELINANIMNNDQEKMNKIREEITKLYEEVDNTSLRVEHFFRELGHMYKIFISDPKKIISKNVLTKKNISKLPEYYAELLISGHTIELLDGDSATMSEAWFLAVCNCISRKIPKLKIFVISILGLQSSGKSTLLNTLFGCKFAVSAGRCTRGIFMQFLFLEKDLSKQLGVDAFILIDTEGLGAPEKMGNPESEKKDRMLATFVMRISNLTIINILGESAREISKILQITINIMGRLDMYPDILMVQHVAEKNTTKLMDLEQKFHENFQEILETVKEKNSDIRARNLDYLSEVKDKKLLKIFAPFKDGITTYSPPSKQYHNDVVDLYNSIIDNCKNSQNRKKFSDWCLLIKSYWDAVSREISSFEEIVETHNFIELGKQIAKLKGTIDIAFLKHKELIETKIRSIVYEWLLKKDSSVNSINSISSKCENLIKKLNDIPEFKNQLDCKVCKKVNKERNKLDKYLEKKNDENCKEETNQTIINYIVSRREFISSKIENMLEGILMRNRFSIFIDRTLEKILSTWEKLLDEKKLEEAANKIWRLLRDKVSAENEDFINEEIDNIVNEEYGTMWTSNFFNNYKFRIIPELSNIDVNVDIARLKKEINIVVEQTLRNIKRFNPRIVRDLKDKTEKKLKEFSTNFNVAFNSNIEMNVHVYMLLNFREKMADIQYKWDKDNTPLSVLDQRKDEYIEIIKLRLQYGHSYIYKGHLTGVYLLRAIHKKAVNAEYQGRRDDVLSTSWIKNSETIRLKYFIELAEQVHDGDKDKALQHFLKPQKSIEEWFKNNVDKYTRKEKGQKHKEIFNTEFDWVHQGIRNCKNYENIKKFVNNYMIQVDGIEYQLDIKDNSITKNFDLFYEAIIKELDAKGSGRYQLEEESLPNLSDDELIKKRLGCTEPCFWCGALCWGERGHDENDDETKIHHSSHQPGGLIGVNYVFTDQLQADACHNRPDEREMHYRGIVKKWRDAKSTDFKDWKFGPHYITDFNEIMCWFFEMLHKDLAAKWELNPASESELAKHGCVENDYYKIISILRTCLKNKYSSNDETEVLGQANSVLSDPTPTVTNETFMDSFM